MVGRPSARKSFIAVVVVAVIAAFVGRAGAANPPNQIKFKMFPTTNTALIPCLAKNANKTPTVNVTVKRGKLNDTLDLQLKGFKPKTGYDLFTIQNTNQDASGMPVTIANFGLAWYQSDIEVGQDGTAEVKIQTILLDQIFGFDPASALTPTNTFHLGFWFDSVAEVASCGTFSPTPFNGEHTAGPLAFITRPNATTGFGPLCTQPNGLVCNP